MTGGVLPRARAGLGDVATAAGVSLQTVSNVVNGRGRYAERTRDRVLAEVARLGYRPHGGAQGLRLRRTMHLGLPLSPEIPLPGHVVMGEFIQAAIVAAADQGYRVVVSAGSDSPAEIHEMVARGSVDAFILSEVDGTDARLRTIVSLGAPFACFGRTPADLPQCWVDIDNVRVMRDIVTHLVGRGHRHIGYIGRGDTRFWNTEREQGFLSAAADLGIDDALRPVRRVADDTVAGVVRALLAAPTRPTAIVTGSDALAATVYAVAADMGLRVGSDLAVTGVDGGVLGQVLVPSLTSAALPVTTIARAVVARALDEVEGPTGRPGQTLYGELVVGGSSVGPTAPTVPPGRGVTP